MNADQIIQRYIEIPLLIAWITLLIPCVVGYILGRFVTGYIRLLILLIIGYIVFQNAGHHVQAACLGNFIYAAFAVIGLRRKSILEEKPFKSYHHLDWLTAITASIVILLMHVPPVA